MPNVFGMILEESFKERLSLYDYPAVYEKFSSVERASVTAALEDLSRDLKKSYSGKYYPGLFKIDLKKKTITFSKDFAPVYFRPQYTEFLREVTREDFFENFCYTDKDPFFVTRLQKLLENETWHYVYDIDVGLQTFDEFVRNIVPDKPYKVFYCSYYHGLRRLN